MKRRINLFIILFIILSIIAIAGMAYAAAKCPLELENDPYPGKCGLYVDDDGNKICDLSEKAQAKKEQPPTPKPTKAAVIPAASKSNTNLPTTAAKNTPITSKALAKATPVKNSGTVSASGNNTTKKSGANEKATTGQEVTVKTSGSPSDEGSAKAKEVPVESKEPVESKAPVESKSPIDRKNSIDSKGMEENKVSSKPGTLPQSSLPVQAADQNREKENVTSNKNFLSSYVESMLSTRNLITLIFLLIASVCLFLQLKWKNFKWLRYVLLLGSLIYLGFVTGGCPSPIGSVQQIPIFFSMIVQGKGLDWVVVFITPIVFAVFFGRVYCTGVCPFGAVQEFVHKAGQKLKLSTDVKPEIDRKLKHFRYVTLISLVALSIITGTAWLCKFDPFKSMFNFDWGIITLIASIILLIASFIISRPYCRYICPYGVILALVSKVALVFKMNKLITWCKKCTVCEKSCPTGAISKGTINEAECIRCGECVDVCPFKVHNNESKEKDEERVRAS